MKNNTLQYCYFFLSFFLYNSLAGSDIIANQYSGFYFKSLEVEDGLSQNMVYSILQDKQGFMWFGTQDGLNRYDGHHFKVYRKKINDPGCIGNSAIFSLLQDEEGILWVGTADGVYLYDPYMDRFNRFDVSTESGVQVEGIVRALLKDTNGNIWIAVSDKGVFCLDSDKKLSYFPIEGVVSGGTGSIRDICTDTEGNIWIATYRNGLLCLIPETGKLAQFFIDPQNLYTADNDINTVFLLNPETLLLGTVNKGVQKLSLRTHIFSSYIDSKEEYNHLFVRTIARDDSGNLWIGTESGVYISIFSGNEVISLKHTFNDPYSISDNAIHSIYHDREGGAWLGTFFGGVSYYNERYTQFEKQYPVDGANSISGKSISEFCEDRNGMIWIGTEDAGLNRFDPVHNTFTSGFIPATNIHALWYDENELWIGTFSEGLFVMDIASGKHKNYKNTSSICSLNNDNIYAIYRDYSGTLWIGSMLGLHIYKPHTNNFERIREDIITTQVNDILEDYYGNIWFATLGGGLYSFDKKNELWSHYSSLGKSDPVAGKMVTCLLEDSRHNVWIGTEGAGFCMFDKKSKMFINHFTVEDGLPNDVIYQLIEDESGYIWGSTNKGLFRLNPQTQEVQTYTHAHGLLGDQFNYKSGFVDKKGKIYFGGVKGFVSFFSTNLFSDPVPPPIVINSFQVSGNELEVGEIDSPLMYSITHTREIQLPYYMSVFTVGFATLSFISPTGNLYAYKLEGHDKDWIYSGSLNRATYSNLPPGSYRFHVKGCNSDGVWNEEGASLQIKISPPFYLTVLAKVLYLVCVCVLIYFFILQARKKTERKNKRVLQALEDEKEKELYQAKIEFFTNVTHEIRTPLSLIKSPLEEIIQQTDTRDEKWENLSIMQRNTNRLLKLVNELLDFRKVESKALQLNFIRVDIVAVVEDILNQFSASARLKGIDIEVVLPGDGLQVAVDPEIVRKIVSNLLNNALKHANKKVKVLLNSDEEFFSLFISNDGTQIPTGYREKVFEPFFKLDENTQGSGLGLPFVKSLIELHEGTIYIDPSDIIGTTFVVRLPIQQLRIIPLKDEQNFIPPVQVHQTVEELLDVTSKPVLLSVEDNEDFQQFMSNQLKSQYCVLKASDGKQALEILNHENVDIIVCDIMMPVMDGMAFCKAVKENLKYSHIPVILLTAKNTLQAKIEGIKIGADEYIVKPYSIDYLRARLENLLENRKKVRESYQHSPELAYESIVHSKADEEFLNKLIEAIHSRIEEVSLDVDELAGMLHMSRATLYRKVKNISALSPNDFIRLIRLKKAAELLKQKQYRVNEIAFIVGFSSSSYFSKCFYKQFGVLPKDFDKTAK